VVGGLILGVGLPIFAPLGIQAFLSWASVIIVLYAIWISVQSLTLSRATTRPFLNVGQFNVIWSRKDEQSASVKYFIVGLCNTGVFPANEMSVILKISKRGVDDQQYSFAVNEGIPTICFPGDEITNLMFKKVDEKEKLEVEIEGELKARIEIEYKNKLTQETHRTKRSYLAKCKPDTNPAPILIPEEDFWI